MNIFYLHPDLQTSAQWHPDKLVVKMPVEACQMAASVFVLYDIGNIPKTDGLKLHDWDTYEVTHPHHPCVSWASERPNQLMYVIQYGLALCAEYTLRYGKKHAAQLSLQWAQIRLQSWLRFGPIEEDPEARQFWNKRNEELMEPPKCMPKYLKIPGQPCDVAYRNFLVGHKAHYARWRTGIIPEWWPNQSLDGSMFCLLSSNPVKPVGQFS